MLTGKDLAIDTLGLASVPSPINLGTEPGDLLADFTSDDARVVVDISISSVRRAMALGREPPSLELAGPRQFIYFDPAVVKAGIVTCGGLSPGLNNVIRGIAMTLHFGYGVQSIYGFRYGFAGLDPDSGHDEIELDPEAVRHIHRQGGTILGTSRGPRSVPVMVDTLEKQGIGILFAIGGDGTFRGALEIHDEVQRRGAEIAVVAIPKTIDDDIPLMDRTFGFNTAVALASEAIQSAYTEASSVPEGVGLVQVMGRFSGALAANAALANRNVNLVLIPEIPFEVDGPTGLLTWLKQRLDRSETTVIVVAEGAGQRLLPPSDETDRSGNPGLANVGLFLKEAICNAFGRRSRFAMKYVDPSYTIRSAPARPGDAIFCGYLAQAAVHAGMAGKTGLSVGRSNGAFTNIPLRRLVRQRKQVDPEGQLWLSVLESTGQPFYLSNEPPKRLARESLMPQH